MIDFVLHFIWFYWKKKKITNKNAVADGIGYAHIFLFLFFLQYSGICLVYLIVVCQVGHKCWTWLCSIKLRCALASTLKLKAFISLDRNFFFDQFLTFSQRENGSYVDFKIYRDRIENHIYDLLDGLNTLVDENFECPTFFFFKKMLYSNWK